MLATTYNVEQQEESNIENPLKKKIVYFAVGPNKHEIICPFCNENIVTKTTQKIDSWDSVSTLIGFFCCCCPFSIISCMAYMIPCFKIRQHYCSKCGEYLGTFRRPKL